VKGFALFIAKLPLYLTVGPFRVAWLGAKSTFAREHIRRIRIRSLKEYAGFEKHAYEKDLIEQTTAEEVRTISRFFTLLIPYWDKLLLSFLCHTVHTPLVDIAIFLVGVQLDDGVLNFSKTPEERWHFILGIAALQLGLWIIGHSLRVLQLVMEMIMEVRILVGLRVYFYDHLMRLSMRFFQKRPIGEHVYRNLEDITPLLSMRIIQFLPMFIGFMYSVAVKCIILAFVDPWISVILLAYIIPLGATQHYFYGHMQKFHVRQRKELQKLFALMREGISGIKTIKSFAEEDYQILKYARQHIVFTRVLFGYIWIRWIGSRIGLLMGEFLRRGVWFYVGYRALKGDFSIGQFTAITLLVKSAERPLSTFLYLIQRQRINFVPARRILETLDVSTDLPEPEDKKKLPPIKGEIKFENVTFGYDPRRPVIKNMSLTIHPGQKVGIVGPSGGGKSTLMYLLMRMYDPDEGAVSVDGHDLRTIMSESYQRQIGVMLQETFLYNATIKDNITFFNKNISDEEVKAAGRMAEVESFVHDEPEGYDRMIDEESNISGGQRQRVGIARALAHAPDLLLFEDPTSALDAKDEELVIAAIKKALEGRTGLLVTHRLNNVADMDHILVIADGQVPEQGTHDELMALDGVYAEMWRAQMQSG